jgi:hypothetical protein
MGKLDPHLPEHLLKFKFGKIHDKPIYEPTPHEHGHKIGKLSQWAGSPLEKQLYPIIIYNYTSKKHCPLTPSGRCFIPYSKGLQGRKNHVA